MPAMLQSSPAATRCLSGHFHAVRCSPRQVCRHLSCVCKATGHPGHRVGAWAASYSTECVSPYDSQSCAGEAPRLLYTAIPSSDHCKVGHPEYPDRVQAVLSALQQHPPTATQDLEAAVHPSQLLDPHSAAVREALLAVHPSAYLDRLSSICDSLQGPQLVDDSTYLAPGSFHTGLTVTAGLLSLLDAVVLSSSQAAHSTSLADHRDGSSSSSRWDPAAATSSILDRGLASDPAVSHAGSHSRSGSRYAAGSEQQQAQGTGFGPMGFCLCRPPGHHVLPNRPMGFGMMNFISVAAEHALRQHGQLIRKVLILDFDVHHGNGTEEIFYKRPEVLYISIHQRGLWPYTGKLQQTGAANGKGATMNLPVPGGSGHQAVELLLEQLVVPAACRFQPDLILVSAGYDAHYLDPLAGLQYEGRTYQLLCDTIRRLAQQLCSGRAVLVLEGGYHVPSLVESVLQSIQGLTGQTGSSPNADLDSSSSSKRSQQLDRGAVAAGPQGAQQQVLLPEEPLEQVRKIILEAHSIYQL